MVKWYVFKIIIFVLLFSSASHAVMNGTVVRVIDGDTVDILTLNNRQFRVRLYAIDAPEKGQAFGQKSTDNLAKYCAGEVAIVDVMDVDRYARLVAVVYCRGVNTNLRQVEDGMAWVYNYFLSKDNQTITHPYYEAEAAAKKAKKGLWQDKDPVSPYQWRQMEKAK